MAKEDNRSRRKEWHENFKNYVEEIVSNDNYRGLPYSRQSDGTVKWVVTGNSKEGKERLEWWRMKAKELGVPERAGYLEKVARMIHPTSKHVCQVCGKAMSIFYVYPTKATLNKVNKIATDLRLGEFSYADKDIFEILDILLKKGAYSEVGEIFKIPLEIRNDIKACKHYVKVELVDKKSKKLSPGVMSNAPDRLDGFHSYGLCCRSSSDLGRHPENLQRYGEDRRAYEFWSDGDWKRSSWLMKEINKKGGSADHIGPISCGFIHGNLVSVSSALNSAKNNRMSLNDINELLEIEQAGKEVASWHSKYIWDNLKYKVKDDNNAKLLSELMVENLLNVLRVLYFISYAGYKEYLLGKLNPEYSFFTYKFETDKIVRTEINRTEERRNIIRYIRISLESLEDFVQKDNRKKKPFILHYPIIKSKITSFIIMLSSKGYSKFYNVDEFVKRLERDILGETDLTKLLVYLKEYKNKAKDPELEKSLNEIIKCIGDVLIEKYNIVAKA